MVLRVILTKESFKKTHFKLKFHCTHCDKIGHPFHRCYAKMLDYLFLFLFLKS